MHEANFWSAFGAGVECGLCPHHCRLAEGQTGICGSRKVAGGKLRAAGYGLISSAHNDPVEKKPLYHFFPGARIFSIGGWGCNFKCAFCQNWAISQARADENSLTRPQEVVAAAKAARSIGIAYTYNEPLINIEFVGDCAAAARREGLRNVLVTNGFVEDKPAEFILQLIDAVNLDIKSMDDGFYRKYCGGALDPVLRFARRAAEACHVEITNLVIPGLNDGSGQVVALAEWVKANLGEFTPLHLSAYRPEYKMDIPPTSPGTLAAAFGLCRKILPYVYVGNVPFAAGQKTLCPRCGNVLVDRCGYAVQIAGLRDGACARCGRKADLVSTLSKDFRSTTSGASD